jgi:hypothetical protein
MRPVTAERFLLFAEVCEPRRRQWRSAIIMPITGIATCNQIHYTDNRTQRNRVTNITRPTIKGFKVSSQDGVERFLSALFLKATLSTNRHESFGLMDRQLAADISVPNGAVSESIFIRLLSQRIKYLHRCARQVSAFAANFPFQRVQLLAMFIAKELVAWSRTLSA